MHSYRRLIMVLFLVALFQSSPAAADFDGDVVDGYISTGFGNLLTPAEATAVVGPGVEFGYYSESSQLDTSKELDVDGDLVTASHLIEGGGCCSSAFGATMVVSELDWAGLEDHPLELVEVVSQTGSASIVEMGDDWVQFSLGGACTGAGCGPVPVLHSITIRLPEPRLEAGLAVGFIALLMLPKSRLR